MFVALFVLIVAYAAIGCFAWWIFSMLLEDFGSMTWIESEAYARVGAVIWPVAIPVAVIGGFGWAAYSCGMNLSASVKTVAEHLKGVFSGNE